MQTAEEESANQTTVKGYHNIRVRRVTPESENEPVEKAAGNKKVG